ncbi:MAG: hypothetical protein KatS3mg131_1081 [Candidatus Tectimicrobiota bacterium]|nr:MAG: hypothetical protein KatS3mg131_1081 [Candidatus Tectomicrobia bacterium]
MHGWATAYLHELHGYLCRIDVTDWHGRRLSFDQGMSRAVELLATAGTSGKILLVGNGGSAAIASHLHNDLCKEAGLRAMVFYDQPLLTALANDLGYEEVFAHALARWSTPGDLLLAISSSGQSANILRAVEVATLHGCRVITFSGFSPTNPLRRLGDVNFYVPAHTYGFVEVAHMVLAHGLADQLLAVRCHAAGRN